MNIMEEAEQLYKEHVKEDEVPNAKDWQFLNESEKDHWYHRAVFYRDFWKNALENPFSVIIGGNCYTIGDENKTGFRGFGGAKFKIKITKATKVYNEGEIIVTTNLWHRGEVPDKYKVENNAITLKEKGYSTLA